MTSVIKDTSYDSNTCTWANIDWIKANKVVNNLQQRIFVAKQKRSFRKMRKLQNLLLSAQSNRQLAVREICEFNSGKNTLGVDNRVYVSPVEKMRLLRQLRNVKFKSWKPLPAKRIYIPPFHGAWPKTKLRPLEIRTLIDRSLQFIVKSALEPEWEAIFEESSYGFRKSRSCHDAVVQLHNICKGNSIRTWIVDADIQTCFDSISHDFLTQEMNSFPGKKIVKNWLKAGYLEEKLFHATFMGTPQGGVISPLLANIALHGMEEALGIIQRRKRQSDKYSLVRYADDFVIACRNKEEAQEAIEILNPWLSERGLSFSKEKTRIVHITEGFNFLGFNFRHYPSQNSNSKLLTKPSQDSIQKIKTKLTSTWKSLIGHSIQSIIKRLNPIIKGWSNYFKIGASSKTFSSLDYFMLARQYAFARRRHPKKSYGWKKSNYWGPLKPGSRDKWVFGDKFTGQYLLKFSWTKIKRHVQVKGINSPFDPALKEYWNKRKSISNRLTTPPFHGLLCRL